MKYLLFWLLIVLIVETVERLMGNDDGDSQ